MSFAAKWMSDEDRTDHWKSHWGAWLDHLRRSVQRGRLASAGGPFRYLGEVCGAASGRRAPPPDHRLRGALAKSLGVHWTIALIQASFSTALNPLWGGIF